MPIYEYECKNCGTVLEAFQSFSEKPLKKCKKCSGKLHKIISQSTFHLKGTGWYVTDYSGKSQQSSAEQNQNEDSSSSKNKGETTKTESKPGKADD